MPKANLRVRGIVVTPVDNCKPCTQGSLFPIISVCTKYGKNIVCQGSDATGYIVEDCRDGCVEICGKELCMLTNEENHVCIF